MVRLIHMPFMADHAVYLVLNIFRFKQENKIRSIAFATIPRDSIHLVGMVCSALSLYLYALLIMAVLVQNKNVRLTLTRVSRIRVTLRIRNKILTHLSG